MNIHISMIFVLNNCFYRLDQFSWLSTVISAMVVNIQQYGTKARSMIVKIQARQKVQFNVQWKDLFRNLMLILFSYSISTLFSHLLELNFGSTFFLWKTYLTNFHIMSQWCLDRIHNNAMIYIHICPFAFHLR